MFDHNILSVLVSLRFALDSPNLWTAVLCLTYNVSKNLWSGFIELVILVDTDGLSFIIML